MKLNEDGKILFKRNVYNHIIHSRILTMMCRKLASLDFAFDLDEIVLRTPGFVGADLSALIDEALVAALNRYEFKSAGRISDLIGLREEDECRFKRKSI